MKSILISLLSLICMCLLMPASSFGQNSTAKYGALAVDRSNGYYYGFAYDYDTRAEAEARALQECSNRGGKGSVVLVWQGTGCAVYRTIDGAAGTAYGWGAAATRAEADAIASRECLKRSNGHPANNFVWGCNTKGSFQEIYNAYHEEDPDSAPVLPSNAVRANEYLTFNGMQLPAWGECQGSGTAAVTSDDESLLLILNNFSGAVSQAVNASFYTDGCTSCLSVQLQDISNEATYIATAGNISTNGNSVTVNVTVMELMSLFSGGPSYNLSASFTCEE